MKRSVMVVYYSDTYPVRATIRDHLSSFARYSGHRCTYLNAAFDPPPSAGRLRPDMVIYHTVFLSQRMAPERWRRLLGKVSFLREAPCEKVALPQDEYVNTNSLNEFLDEFGVKYVFPLASEATWPTIYPDYEERGLKLTRVLPGYLSDRTRTRIDNILAENRARSIDIGYRAWSPWPCLGRHGLLKGQIGAVFRDRSVARGLTVDISTDLNDTILGDEWFRFLCRCKYTLGVEGGASILDAEGSLMRRTVEFVAQNPEATFEEVEAECFAGREGSLDYRAISPRHLEACATRTCQILVEGDYAGVLEPWVHYIPVRSDFEDVDEVLDLVADDSKRQAIVDRAYRDIVDSGLYSYEALVGTIMDTVGSSMPDRQPALGNRLLASRLGWIERRRAARIVAKAQVRRLAVSLIGEDRVLSSMRRVRKLMGRE